MAGEKQKKKNRKKNEEMNDAKNRKNWLKMKIINIQRNANFNFQLSRIYFNGHPANFMGAYQVGNINTLLSRNLDCCLSYAIQNGY